MKFILDKWHKQRGALSYQQYLLIFFLFAATGVGFFLYSRYKFNSPAATQEKVIKEQEATETKIAVEKKAVETNAKLTLARNQQEQLLAQARTVAAGYEKRIPEMAGLIESAAAFKTNLAGRKAAAHHDLVVQARRLYEAELKDLPANQELIEKLEGVRRIEQQLVDAQGTAFEPPPEMVANLQSASVWGETAGQTIARVQTHLTGIAKEGSIKYNPNPVTDTSPTLEEGMQKLAAIEVAAYETRIAASQTEGKIQAADIVAQATAKGIVEDANIKAQQILDEAKAKAAEFERQRKIQEANMAVTNAIVRTNVEVKVTEAQRILLKQRASDPSIKTKLAAYVTPGYYVPYLSGKREPLSREPRPMSYSKLIGVGATQLSERGLRAFIEVGKEPNNDRPDLPGEFKMTRWDKNAQSHAAAAELQNLLIELGPTLVEMGILDP